MSKKLPVSQNGPAASNFLDESARRGSRGWSVMPIFPARRLPHPGPAPQRARTEQGEEDRSRGGQALPSGINGLRQDATRYATLRHALHATGKGLLVLVDAGRRGRGKDTVTIRPSLSCA